MTRKGKAHPSEDIWHLSIEDLLGAPNEPTRLVGAGPFVINLSTSTASIAPPPKGLPRFDTLHLYQVRRGPRFLLRLGIIATEMEADAILARVLEHYPAAVKDSAEDDDKAAVAATSRPAEPPKPVHQPAAKPPEVRQPPPKPPANTQIRSPAVAPADAAPTRSVVENLDCDPDEITVEVEIPTFTFEPPTTAIPSSFNTRDADEDTVELPNMKAPEPPAITPQRSATGARLPQAPAVQPAAPAVQSPASAVQPAASAVQSPAPAVQPAASAVQPAAPAVQPAAPAVQPAAPAVQPAAPAVQPAAPAVQPARPAVQPAAPAAPAIGSAQATRALPPLELPDDHVAQWFSIQLALSPEHIDPEQVPDLDLYKEYRLYSVAGLHDGRVMYALRLGFFSSELAAAAVAGYLRGFFDSPSIKGVSLAERERFAQKGVTARKDVGATGMHTVIELAGPSPLPERHSPVSESDKRRSPGSVWSRLITPLKR